MRTNIILQCTVCKRRNYVTVKNKKNTTERLERKKYCPWDRSTRFTAKYDKHIHPGGMKNPARVHAGQ